jgi:hypothetical protein
MEQLTPSHKSKAISMTPVTKADGERNSECSSFVVAIVCCVVTFFDSNDLMLFTFFAVILI